MRKKGFTLIELLVVIAIIAMLLAILMPALSKVKKIAQRVVCGTNLKGLGTAQVVYANDYDDDLARQGGTGGTKTWATYSVNGPQTTGWENPARAWGGDQTLSVAASLYLLVREADVSPKSFVCPSSDQTPFDTTDYPAASGLDIIELWDFGPTPEKHVSYSYHQPYGSRPASASEAASFGLMADRNPWCDPKLVAGDLTSANSGDLPSVVGKLKPYWASSKQKYEIEQANAESHDRQGQNVAFADGHNSFENTADVGIKHDNVYTRQSDGTELGVRQGAFGSITPGAVTTATDARNSNDSLLVNDSINGTD